MCCTGLLAAENLVLLDQEITITQGTHYWDPPEHTPKNWTEPIDYSKGILHIQWEILEAPEDAAGYQLQLGWRFPEGSQEGMPRNPTRAGLRHDINIIRTKYQRLLFWEREWGIHNISAPPDELPDPELATIPYWIPGATYHTVHIMGSGRFFLPQPSIEPKNFRQGIDRLMAYSRDPAWRIRGPSAPVRMHVTMTLVPPGGSYSPPTRFGGITPEDLPDLPMVAAAMEKRQPGQALAAVESMLADNGHSAPVQEQLALAKEALNNHADEELERSQARFDRDPLAALNALSELAQAYQGTSRHAALMELGREWTRHDAVRTARQADAIYRRAAGMMGRIPESADLSDPSTQQRHATILRQVATDRNRLMQQHPDSAALRSLNALLQARGLIPAPED
ncbi:MAG: hypothetical protein EA401_10240 [Planctomycetota bacterium]|nr:MAG: hypothetical protein EA401_10240 [Planctomycetota bacterium]